MRRPLQCLLFLIIGMFLTSWMLKNLTEVRYPHKAIDIFSAESSGMSIDNLKCMLDEKRHVVFIKVHKAGSSTIANILFRFGMTRNLTFLLPEKGVTVALNLTIPWTNIMALPTRATHYDMLSNHAMYVKSEIDRLFPRDREVITILRHPMGQLESSMYYYYKNAIEGDDKAGKYLDNPKSLKSNDRYVNNSMAFELGVPRGQFHNASFVRAHVKHIADDIKLVMIMERLQESLVLMKRSLCWGLKDIIYITRNVNKDKPSFEREDVDFFKHRKMMEANYIVYEFFYKRLEDEIASSPRLEEEVNHYKTILQFVSKFCLEEQILDIPAVTIPRSEWNEVFSISKKDCVFLQYSGLEVLYYAKKHQYRDV